MKLIGVISDTHDRLPTFAKAVQMLLAENVTALFHAGDYVAPFAAKLIAPAVLPVPLYCVYGNNDGERKGLKTILPNLVEGPLRVQLHQRTIVMHHFIDWLKPQDVDGADLVITGHTHAIVNEQRNGRLYLNPGECCGWLTGRCTVAVVELESLTARILEIPA